MRVGDQKRGKYTLKRYDSIETKKNKKKKKKKKKTKDTHVDSDKLNRECISNIHHWHVQDTSGSFKMIIFRILRTRRTSLKLIANALFAKCL